MHSSSSAAPVPGGKQHPPVLGGQQQQQHHQGVGVKGGGLKGGVSGGVYASGITSPTSSNPSGNNAYQQPVGSYLLTTPGQGPRRLSSSSTGQNPVLGGSPSTTATSSSSSATPSIQANRTNTTAYSSSSTPSPSPSNTAAATGASHNVPPAHLAQPGAYNPRRLSSIGTGGSGSGGNTVGNGTYSTNASNPYHALLTGGSPQSGGASASSSGGRGGTSSTKSPSRLRVAGGVSGGGGGGALSRENSTGGDSLRGSPSINSDNQTASVTSGNGSARRQHSSASNSRNNSTGGSPFPVGSGANAVSVLANSRGPSPTTNMPVHGSVTTPVGGRPTSGGGGVAVGNVTPDGNPTINGHPLFPFTGERGGSSHSLHSVSSSGTLAPNSNATTLLRNNSSTGSVYSAMGGSAMQLPNSSSVHTALSDLKRDSIRNSSSQSINGTSSTSLHSDAGGVATTNTTISTPALTPQQTTHNATSPYHHLDTPNRSVQVLRRISQCRADEVDGSQKNSGMQRRGSTGSNDSLIEDEGGLGSRSDSERSLRSVPSGMSLPTINIAISDNPPAHTTSKGSPSSTVKVPSNTGSANSTTRSVANSGSSSGTNTSSSLNVGQEPEMLFRKNSKYESPFALPHTDSPSADILGSVGDHLLSSTTSPSSASGSTPQAFMMSSSGLLSVDQSWAWDAPPRGGTPGRRVSINGAAAAPAANSTQARQRRLSSIYCEFAVKVEDFLRQPHISSASSNSAETPRESHCSSPSASPQVGAITNPDSKRVKPTLSGFSNIGVDLSVPNTSFGSASGHGGQVGRSISGNQPFSAGASLSNLSVPMFQHSRRRSSRANAEPEEQGLGAGGFHSFSNSGNLISLLDPSNMPPPRSPSKYNISTSHVDSKRTSPSRSSNGNGGNRKRSSGLRSLALRSLWQLIDVEGVGEVSCDRLLAAFEKVGFQRVHSREKIKTMFAIADVNKNGMLNWQEFSKFFKHLASVDLLEAEDREEALAKRRSSSYTSSSMGRSVNASTNHIMEPAALAKRSVSSGSGGGGLAGEAKPDYFSCSTTSSPSSPAEGSFSNKNPLSGAAGVGISGENPFSTSGEFSLEKHNSGGGGGHGTGDVSGGSGDINITIGESLIHVDETNTNGDEDEDDDLDDDLTDFEDDDDELSEANIRKRQAALMKSYSNPISQAEQRSLEAAGPEAALMSASATTAVPLDGSTQIDGGSSSTATAPPNGRRHTVDLGGDLDSPQFSITIDNGDGETITTPPNSAATSINVPKRTSVLTNAPSGPYDQRVDPAASGLLGVEGAQIASISRRPSVSYNPNTRRRISTCPAHRMKPTVLLRRYSVKILSGLRQRIKCIALAPRRPLIAACHRQENSVHIYDLEGNELRVLSGHKDSMLGVAFSVDRKAIATASRDKTVTVWDCTVGHELGVVEHPGIVTAIAFSADGKSFFTGCQDNLVRRFHTHKCRYLRCMETLPNSHQGVIVALAAQHHANELILCSRSCDKCALVLDAQTLEVVAALEGHSSMVWQAQFNADGSRIVTLCETSVIVWEASMLQPLQTFPSALLAKHGFPKPMPPANPKTGKKPKVKAKLWTTALFCPAPLGTLLACFGTDASVLFFDYISGELVLQLQLRSTAYCAAATDDGDRIVCGDDWGNLYQIMLSA